MTTQQELESKGPHLFHYTIKKHFRNILLEGLRPSYCVEEFEWLFDTPTYIAFPVVCFCDIPISAASSHRKRYEGNDGTYAIAISKEFASFFDICPIWYIQEDTQVQKHLTNLLSLSRQNTLRPTLNAIPDAIKPLLPFIKSTIGTQPDRQATRPGTFETLAFEEELEWRYSPLSLMNTWKLSSDRDDKDLNEHEQDLKNYHLKDHSKIDSIYVPTKEEVKSLERDFPDLTEKIKVWPDLP